jgi:DNA repair protein RecN (Recombination protein N)
MLSHLRISHFAIIDALEARFDSGFNVVSGETGAGKSILIDALHLLLGGRAQADLVRTGFDECSVEGLFEPIDVAAVNSRLETAGLPACEEHELIIRRVVHREGRSRVWVNGALATVGQLSQIVRRLVDISSQHEHTSLLDTAGHLSLLDLFAGLAPQIETYHVAYLALAAAARELKSLQLNEAERARRIDYLQFQLEEIEKLDPKAGEEEKLREQRQKLASAEKLRTVTNEAESLLYSRDGAATELLTKAADQLEKAVPFDATLKPYAESLRLAMSQVSDVARDLGRYSRGVADDPARLEEIEERLEALRKLARKHGGDLATVLVRRDAMRQELEKLTSYEAQLAQAEAIRAQRLSEARRLAQALTKTRQAAAKQFAAAVVARLADLEMKRTVLEVRVSAAGAEADGAIEGTEAESAAGRLNPKGQDEIEFLISPNPGEEPRPIARIASGGELSRVMLAIKRVLAERDPVETYVFDEVDAGIGGTTGEVVGRMIREVARDRQVLCITHLAQIAAYSEAHFTVEKSIKDGRTQSSLNRLDGAEPRQREIARMLSGHLTPASLEHAGELIQRGHALGAERRPAKKSRKAS